MPSLSTSDAVPTATSKSAGPAKSAPAPARPGAAAPAPARPGAPTPAGKPAVAAPTAAAVTRTAPLVPSAASASMDALFAEAGFELKTGQFCPACNELLKPGAVLCTNCGFHLETGTKLQAHQVDSVAHDSAESALKRAELNMKKAKEADEKLQAAGMPPWMMAMMLFILTSCTAVGVIAVNVSRRSKDTAVSFNALATMLMLAGVAFTAVSIGSTCIVIYRAFKESPAQGLMVMFIPGYILFYGASRFQTAGKVVIVSVLTSIAATTLYVLAGMSNSGQF